MSKQATASPGHRAGPAQSPYRHPAGLVAASLVTSVWVLLYALYRGYSAAGGTVGMIGTFRPASEWRALNLAGAVILLAVAVLPVMMLPLWRRPGVRRVLLGVCWVLAVGFIMHALVQDAQRILSLTGHLHVSYPPQWKTLNRHAADIQDLAFNETWFLITGLLWALPAGSPWVRPRPAAGGLDRAGRGRCTDPDRAVHRIRRHRQICHRLTPAGRAGQARPGPLMKARMSARAGW